MGDPSKTAFSPVKKLTICAMLTAVSVVIGIICKNFFTFGIYYRVTFENMSVIMAGALFGPVAGAMVGAAADVVSCLCSTNPAVNPVITLGAAVVGASAGVIARYVIPKRSDAQLALAAGTAHLLGQVAVKSVAKMIWFGMPWWGSLIGLGISAVVAPLEFLAIRTLLRRLKLG